MNSLRIGKGCQIAGLVLIVLGIVLVGCFLACRPSDWRRSSHLGCTNNLKQIGLAFRTWAIDNDGKFPFNVSTNAGGTMELCARGSDGFDRNAALHFQVMSNELSTPKLLVCPNDWASKPAVRFQNLQATNVSYLLHSGTNLNEGNPNAMLALCPFDGNTLYCDGSVAAAKADWKPPKRVMMEIVRRKYSAWMAVICRVFMVSGVVLLWAGSRLKWKAKGGPKPIGLIIGEFILLTVVVLLAAFMLFTIVGFAVR
jgi:prepilin-type processing-associated H-X9-DG protein